MSETVEAAASVSSAALAGALAWPRKLVPERRRLLPRLEPAGPAGMSASVLSQRWPAVRR